MDHMRRILNVLLLTAAAIVTLAGPASAHTELVATAPVDGAVAKGDLRSVTLTFTEPVDPRLATVAVRAKGGDLISQGGPEGSQLTLVQQVKDVGVGRYEVGWRAAAADGHILSGDFGFRVGARSAAPPVAAAEPKRLSPAEQLLQHAKGNYKHDAKPSYAVAAKGRPRADDKPAGPPAVKLGPPAAAMGPPAAPVAPAPAPDNATSTIVALLAAALGVTTVTAVVESRRAA